MMDLLIKPVDVWLFRDGRPFLAGEDHDAATIFPPTPFTLQGAIRTKVLADKGVDFSQFKSPDPDVGYGDNFGKLRLRGPMLVRKSQDGKWERLIPVPADVMKVVIEVGKRKVCEYFILLKPDLKLPFKTNLPEGLQLLWEKWEGETPVEPQKFGSAGASPSPKCWGETDWEGESPDEPKKLTRRIKEAKGWLPESEWERYLRGEAPKQIVSNEELFAFEPRFGITIDRGKRTTQTQMLYRANFVRLKDGVALWAKVEWEGESPDEPQKFGSAGDSPSQSAKGVPLKPQGFLRFGGEGRSASYEAIDSLPSLASYTPKLERRFKVVLISPAWFSGGWQPKDGNWAGIFGAPVRLVAAAIPRPQKFGGFDLVKGEPKPIRNFVPAGAVYFFEADEPIELCEGFAFTETPDVVRKANDDKNAWADIGFGDVLVGSW